MKSFCDVEAAKRIVEFQRQIHELEKQADAMQAEYVESTRFLTDEQRGELIDYFADQAKENSDSDDSVERHLENSYYGVGSSNWTDRELLSDFAQDYRVEMELIEEVPIWKEVLSHSVVVLAVMGELLEEQEGA